MIDVDDPDALDDFRREDYDPRDGDVHEAFAEWAEAMNTPDYVEPDGVWPSDDGDDDVAYCEHEIDVLDCEECTAEADATESALATHQQSLLDQEITERARGYIEWHDAGHCPLHPDPVRAMMDAGNPPPPPQSANTARDVIARHLATVSEWTWRSGGFRTVLLKAAFTLGGYVGAEVLTEAEARTRLREAVPRSIWPAGPNSDDNLWITQGLNDGQLRPFRVYSTEGE